MKARRYYLAKFESQRDSGPLASTNCAAASGAMLADQASLGGKDPGVRWFRRQTDDFEGGLRMEQVAAVLEDIGVEVLLFDHRNRLTWERLARYLRRGWFAQVGGDYGVLPPDLQATSYDGGHSVVFHQLFKENLRVGDPLQRDWLRWPRLVARRYVEAWDAQTAGGIHAIVMRPRKAHLRSGIISAYVRALPRLDAEPMYTLVRPKSLVTGGLVKGERLAGSDRWRRVWVPKTASVGYVPWSQTGER